LFNVVKGWGEGLQLVGEGGSLLLVIPPQLAYGARGAPPRIGPNETLVFRVDLIKVLSNPA
jgi:FKBP-type peptidyl-prolyl cis-trans isomerase